MLFLQAFPSAVVFLFVGCLHEPVTAVARLPSLVFRLLFIKYRSFSIKNVTLKQIWHLMNDIFPQDSAFLPTFAAN